MKIIPLGLMLMMISSFSMSQVRMVSHISKESGGFLPGFIIGNIDSASHSYMLEPFEQNGNALPQVSRTITGNTTSFESLESLFGTTNVSHFKITGDSQVKVTVTYKATTENASAVHVLESSVQSDYWRIYSGNWDVLWDGIAVVNTGSTSINVVITHKRANGTTINSKSIISGLAPNAKALYVIAGNFNQEQDSYFEISADEPIAITALRGTYAGAASSLLWENRPISSATNAVAATPIIAKAVLVAGQSHTGSAQWAPVPGFVAEIDTHGALDSSGAFTCPEDGIYRVASRIDAKPVSDTSLGLAIYKNGVRNLTATGSPGGVWGKTIYVSGIISCNSGDVLQVQFWANESMNDGGGGIPDAANQFTIEKISD